MHNSILSSDKGGAIFRGAVTFGDYYFDPAMKLKGIPITPPVLVGKAVIEAHEWERAQKWIGCSFAPAALKTHDGNFNEAIRLMIDSHYLIPWDVPTSYGIEETVAVNFVVARHSEALMERLNTLDVSENHPSIKAKIRATKKFIEYVSREALYPPLDRYQD